MLSTTSQESEDRMRNVRRKIALMDRKSLERKASEARELLHAELAKLEEAIEKSKVEQDRLNAAKEKLVVALENLNATDDKLKATEEALNRTDENVCLALASTLFSRMTKRFGGLPVWVEERLALATRKQLEEWGSRVEKATCFEDCMNSV